MMAFGATGQKQDGYVRTAEQEQGGDGTCPWHLDPTLTS